MQVLFDSVLSFVSQEILPCDTKSLRPGAARQRRTFRTDQNGVKLRNEVKSAARRKETAVGRMAMLL